MRRKSAPDTLRPLLKELKAVIQLAASALTTQEGRAIISGISVLCQKIAKWTEIVAGGEHDDTRISKVTRKPLLGLTFNDSIRFFRKFSKTC